MRRGTTPTLKIELEGLDLTLLKELYLTFEQDCKQLTKHMKDLEIDYDLALIKVYLTQEETLSFKAGKKVEVQIRAITKDGNKLATNIGHINVSDILLDGIIEATEGENDELSDVENENS